MVPSTRRTRPASANGSARYAAKQSGSRSSSARSASSAWLPRVAATIALEAARTGRVEFPAKRRQVQEPLSARQKPRVGDGVGGAGEEIGQADGGADLPRQHRQGEIEGPADSLEEGAGQVRTGQVLSPYPSD